MSIKESLIVKGDTDKIYTLFASEDKLFKNKRSGYTLHKEKGCVIFNIYAEDKNALKITKNSIKKMLDIFNKTKRLIESE